MKATKILTIRKDGQSSMKVTVTELAQKIGAGVGDQIRVTVERIDE